MFRGMSKPQMTRLLPDIALIESSDAGAEEAHLSTNTYALLNAGRMLLLDTNVSTLLPFVRQLSDNGYSPSALVLSHRHVVGLGDAIDDLSTEFKIPVLLHPIDTSHQQALVSGIQFENPVGHPILGEFGFEAPARLQAPSFCIRPSTEAFFLLVIQQWALLPIRQKPVWSVWLGHQ